MRCQDLQGRANIEEYSIQFVTDPEPDREPPRLLWTDPESESFVSHDHKELPVQFVLSEPAHCLWSSLVILSDGNVVNCCTNLYGSDPIGNAFEKSLMEIWNSDKAIEMREKQAVGDFSSSKICSTCPEIKVYTPEDAVKLLEKIEKQEKESGGAAKFNQRMQFIMNRDPNAK